MELNLFHAHQGPHSGANRTCFGLYSKISMSKLVLPSLVERSPSSFVNLLALRPLAMATSQSSKTLTSHKSYTYHYVSIRPSQLQRATVSLIQGFAEVLIMASRASCRVELFISGSRKLRKPRFKAVQAVVYA